MWVSAESSTSKMRNFWKKCLRLCQEHRSVFFIYFHLTHVVCTGRGYDSGAYSLGNTTWVHSCFHSENNEKKYYGCSPAPKPMENTMALSLNLLPAVYSGTGERKTMHRKQSLQPIRVIWVCLDSSTWRKAE
jgi:hypothetical protein